tara:strand:- start:1794 stop:4526 length:2733 start_codon:yes stop_codon:yes gene_type:complete
VGNVSAIGVSRRVKKCHSINSALYSGKISGKIPANYYQHSGSTLTTILSTKRSAFFIAMERHCTSWQSPLLHLMLPVLGVMAVAASPAALGSDLPNAWDCTATENNQWRCAEKPAAENTRRREPSAKKPTLDPDEPRVADVRNLDWVEEEQMSEEQRRKIAPNCCGAYIEPAREYPDADLEPEEASLRVNANSTETLPGNVAVLDGDVQISQGYRQVRSNNARIDQTERTVALEGNVQFREPGLLLLGESAEVDIDSKEITLKDATYVLHDVSVRGNAKTLSRAKDGVITITDATYSTCEPGDSTWQMQTSEISIDQESGFATVKNAQLRVKDVPIFYVPWIKFPVNDNRVSGLLFPTIHSSTRNGFDYAQPIYWNIAENYDATITPRYMQERGLALNTEFRHLSNLTTTDVVGEFLGNDKGGKDDSDIDPLTGLPEYRSQDRYLIGLTHLGGIGEAWSTYMDVNKVSDNDYFRDLGGASQESTSIVNLRRVAGATYKTEHWDYRIEAQDHQIVVDGLEDQYSVLPQISVNGYYRFDNNLVMDINNQISQFDHDNPDVVTGNRNRTDYGITWDKRWTWGYFRPQFRIKYLSYNLDLNSAALTDESPSATVPVSSIDTALFFERDNSWFSGYTQTLEPRLYYVKAEFKDQSAFPDFDIREFTPSYNLLFRDERFNGGDRISDEDRLTMALTTRYIDKKTGQERFTASIAQSVNYQDRYVSLTGAPSELAELARNQSPLALKMSGRVNNSWRFTTDIIYDGHDNEMDKSIIGVRYNDRQNRVFNATYRSTKRVPRLVDNAILSQDIEQVDLSAFLPVAGNFNVVARWNYDFTNNRPLDIFTGFEYNSCCWRASVVARRWLERKDQILVPEQDLNFTNGIFFQIQFKGLAGSSSRVDSMLKNGIYGYDYKENL